MLLKLMTLSIENQGYKREVSSKPVYVNTKNIISISDYFGIKDFLSSEGLSFSDSKFSVVKISHGHKTEEIIAFGTSEHISGQIQPEIDSSRLLLNE